MDPESVLYMRERNGRTHRHDVGIGGNGQHDGSEDGEHLHGHVELVGEQGVVGFLERFDQLLAVFEDIPDADIGPDEILEIHSEVGRDQAVFFLDDGFDDGALRLDGSAEIKDIALDEGYLEHHFLFLFAEDLVFDIVEVFGNVVETGKAGLKQELKHFVEKVRRRLREMKSLLAVAFRNFPEKPLKLVDLVAMRGDEIVFGDDHIELARVRGALDGVEKGDMYRKEKAVVVADGLGLIGRGEKLLDRQRMDIEMLLKIEDVVVRRFFEIDPADRLVMDDFHRFCF